MFLMILYTKKENEYFEGSSPPSIALQIVIQAWLSQIILKLVNSLSKYISSKHNLMPTISNSVEHGIFEIAKFSIFNFFLKVGIRCHGGTLTMPIPYLLRLGIAIKYAIAISNVWFKCACVGGFTSYDLSGLHLLSDICKYIFVIVKTV
eukprot:NODE_550_length_6175_cov_0.398453.p6 type:complete len:149 gc:universal NODE_550_length_6175_cov_0.398453:3091-2645(-)